MPRQSPTLRGQASPITIGDNYRLIQTVRDNAGKGKKKETKAGISKWQEN